MIKKVYRKGLVFGIIILFFIMSLYPTFEADLIESKVVLENNMSNNTFTHTVLGEESTATWCGYCPEASAQLYQVYNMGYDFDFVTLVADMNPYADGRCNELGITGYPTVDFDGGYTTIIGQQSSYTVYQNAVINCGARAVADITIGLTAYWLGDGLIEVNAAVTNNGANTYNGHLHAYVTEITSRWDDASGEPYHFAMINDYALNKAVTVSASATQTFSATWSGYDDISMSNIRVIASVFAQSSMYTDETKAVDPQEKGGGGEDLILPKVLISYPTENETVNGTITITGTASDLNGTIQSVYINIGNEGWTKAMGTEQWKLIWDTTTFDDGMYTISAVAINNHGLQSSIVHIKAYVKNNESKPPEKPSKPDGITNGISGVEYMYTTNTSDLDGDQVRYGWDWNGDFIVDDWTGYFPSGQTINNSHIWQNPGGYNIQVIAEDSYDYQSEWSDSLAVNISENHPPNKPSTSYDRKSNNLIISAKDSDGDFIRYGISWDNDGTADQWTDLVSSGTEQSIDCKDKKGTVGVIVEDEHGGQSSWVSIKSKEKSVEYQIFNFLLDRLFYRFPIFEKILNQYY